MLNPNQIEAAYKEFVENLQDWVHDGVIPIDLQFLHDQHILDSLQDDKEDPDDLTQYFHVVEGVEKVTLFNDQFIVWIVPKSEGEQPSTSVFIALNHTDKPHLEVVFTTKGVYNSPRYVLKVLQHFLIDMLETEATLTAFEKNA
ncbi:MAG: hypothetical protein HY069_04715 [Chlamydiia bacterium]|nr:hypothetical protein [Chlamydiia bacterium]